MSSAGRIAIVAAGVVALALVAPVIARLGRPGGAGAEEQARQALARLGFEPAGTAAGRPEGEHELAWALERARAGAAGRRLAAGEGGALRWRVVFQGGGEVGLTESGLLWSLRRPLPTDPGPALYRPRAGARLEQTLAGVVPDPEAWRLDEVQTWDEDGITWYRGRFLGGPGGLPRGWRREAEVEIAGSTLVGFARRVQPLGIDVGVVQGRVRELELLRAPALVGLGVVVLAMLATGVTSVVRHRPVAWVPGAAAAAAIGVAGAAAGGPVSSWGAQALAVGALLALLPAELRGTRAGWGWGAWAGLGAVGVALGGRVLVAGMGGFVPVSPHLPAEIAPWSLAGAAWLSALIEEPLLRGAVPALARPLLGWWGAALLGVPVGALLHPLPAVPLPAAVGLEAAVQLVLVAVAWRGGVAGAVAARGVLESVLRRPGFPAGWPWDLAALAGLAVGVACLAARRRH
ncbi:MAG TPA: hypothetical protein P5234_10485 [Thermoanaerobaculaceae bacterium]|nr:hypothetical protein [Thermoanaerobaculaceae bacterium]HRS16655.1 hypothetical protein [Thermoanaerobaculaceae bacterium]